MFEQGMIVLAITTALVAAPAQSAPAEDAHIVRRLSGDVIEFHRDATARDAGPDIPPYPGWRYSSVRPGDRLRPAFLHTRYAVPPALRPPGAQGSRRWFRYGPDLLLVDMRDGRVVRVVGSR